MDVVQQAQRSFSRIDDERGIASAAQCMIAVGCLLALAAAIAAEDLEPRRWSHTPIGLNTLSLGYAYTDADVLFDPATRLEDVHLTMQAGALKYLHAFELLGRTARVELTQGYAVAHWTGKIDGVHGTVDREGLTDSQVRFAINLVGAPPLAGKAFQEYRAQPGLETTIGAALIVHLPTGDYVSDKLLNIGTNRFTFRPQLGVLHNWDQWSFEYTGSVWFFTKNDDFYNDTTMEQGPLYSAQGHVVYSPFRGVWVGLSGAYTHATESTIDGNHLHDGRDHLLGSLGVGFPLASHVLGKIAYVGARALDTVGADSDSVTVGLGYLW